MAQCATCGNEYDRCIKVTADGKTWQFDSFECAIHKLAPACEHCGCKVLGHGVESGEEIFCSAHCARERGVQGLAMHVDGNGNGHHQPGR